MAACNRIIMEMTVTSALPAVVQESGEKTSPHHTVTAAEVQSTSKSGYVHDLSYRHWYLSVYVYAWWWCVFVVLLRKIRVTDKAIRGNQD